MGEGGLFAPPPSPRNTPLSSLSHKSFLVDAAGAEGKFNNTLLKIKGGLKIKNCLQSKEAGGFWWTPVEVISEDDHSHWAPPYWIITKATFSLGRTEL